MVSNKHLNCAVYLLELCGSWDGNFGCLVQTEMPQFILIVGGIAMKYSTDFNGSQRMSPDDFCDSLTFNLTTNRSKLSLIQ